MPQRLDKLRQGASSYLKDKVSKLSLTDNVRLVGAKLDMKSEYAGFDVFVMSSIAEGIPMTLLESMACSIPPVVTRVGGIPEVVDEKCGFLYESGDAVALAEILLYLFENPQKVKTMGRFSRDVIVKKYSEKSMVAEYAKLYQGDI